MHLSLISSRLAARHRLLPTGLALAIALGLSACASGPQSGAASGAPLFSAQDAAFKGRVNVVDTPVVLAGKPVTLAGRNFKAGQKVRFSYGGVALGQTTTVGTDGTFRAQFTLPANAAAGRYQLLASVANPAASLLVPLKISPLVPISGQDRFDAQFKPLVPGLYQVAYSAKSDKLFVTSAAGRPPSVRSELVKVNPQTLAIEARVTPPEAPAPANPPANAPGRPGPAVGAAPAGPNVYAVYGVGVDDANGNVWVTNTRQNTVAVYRQSDLKLVRQFEPGTVAHARDVIVDEPRGKAYASATGTPFVIVFDAKAPAVSKKIELKSEVRGPDAKPFSPMSLALDEKRGKLYVVSMSTDEVAIIDTRTDTVEQLLPVPAAVSASGVAYDSRNDRILVAGQGSDNLVIVDAKTGKTLYDVDVGAGALNVAYDPVRGLAYVASRAAGTVTVVDPGTGKIVANLGGGTFPNHLTADGKGQVFVVNKSRGQNDDAGDRIGRLAPR